MKKLALFLICALVLSCALMGCAEKAELNDAQSGAWGSGNAQGGSETAGGSDGSANGGTGDGTPEETPADNTSKDIFGVFAAENGDVYTFNEGRFSFATGNYCLSGTYTFKETEDGNFRILLTVTAEGKSENFLTPVASWTITSGDGEGLSFSEGGGYIKIDITKYYRQ